MWKFKIGRDISAVKFPPEESWVPTLHQASHLRVPEPAGVVTQREEGLLESQAVSLKGLLHRLTQSHLLSFSAWTRA